VTRKIKLEKLLLSKTQLCLRDDSKLAWGYISDTSVGWTLESIINEIALTHYLYNYTKYNELVVSNLHLLDGINSQFELAFLKLQAMQMKHPLGDYPTVWPWIKVGNI